MERSEHLDVLDLSVVSLNAEHVSAMVEAIYHSRHTQLKSFVLAKMGITFETNPDLQEMMCEFISRQEKLETAIVNYTLLRSADETTRVLETLMQPGVLNTIKKVGIYGSDFTQNETCELLAQFIATAPKLDYVGMDWQLHSRGITGRVI